MTELEKLEQRILEESRRFPEVSFAKLSRIAKHFYDFGKERFVEPQGLEEAAEEYALKKEEPLADGEMLSGAFNPRIDAFKAGAIWMFEKAPSEQAIAYVKAFHSASEVSEFQAAMNIAAAKAFDAGARWMAEQGETIKGEVLRYSGSKTLWFEDDSLKDLQNFEAGEEVIVQIRKKEE